MSARYWIKTPVAWLDDPRVAALPDSVYRRYVECNLLAKDEETADEAVRGFIPDIPLAAWRLHIPPDVLADDLARLALAGLMELRRHPDGGERWFVTNYPATQRAATDAERKQQERERAAKRGWTAERHESVTIRDTEPEPPPELEPEPKRKTPPPPARKNGATAPGGGGGHHLRTEFQKHGYGWDAKVVEVAALPWVTPEYIAAHTAAAKRDAARDSGIKYPLRVALARMKSGAAAELPSGRGSAADDPEASSAWRCVADAVAMHGATDDALDAIRCWGGGNPEKLAKIAEAFDLSQIAHSQGGPAAERVRSAFKTYYRRAIETGRITIIREGEPAGVIES